LVSDDVSIALGFNQVYLLGFLPTPCVDWCQLLHLPLIVQVWVLDEAVHELLCFLLIRLVHRESLLIWHGGWLWVGLLELLLGVALLWVLLLLHHNVSRPRRISLGLLRHELLLLDCLLILIEERGANP
jgi:hypothetical protein